MAKQMRYGMVGGSMNAFIGEVHRKALAFDPRAEFVAGCFSSQKDRNDETGETYHLAPDRVYDDYTLMAEAESNRLDGIDFIVIVTPNHMHYAVARAFLEKGIHVVCEKPLCFTIEEAEKLVRLAKEKDLFFGVTYTYTGYTMVKVMKEAIEAGKIGKILSINAEYAQDWLLNEIGDKQGDSKLSIWRTDPKYTGIANCVGDIGTHIENMVHYLTGFKIKRLAATTNTFGKELDMNANMLIEYENGVNGAYWCSQIASGNLNGLRVRIYGEKGSFEWEQHFPDYVRYTPKNQPTELLSRGTSYITEHAGSNSRIPAGHPEGLFVAFANIYRNFISAIIKKRENQPLTKDDLDFPTAEDGLNGVKFVHAVVDSAKSGSVWIDVN